MCNLEEIKAKANEVFTEAFEDIFETFHPTAFIDILPCSVIFSDRVGLICGANDTALSMLGYSHQELMNLTWQDITFEDDLELSQIYADMQSLSLYDRCYTIPKRYKTKQGEIRYCLTTISRINFGAINKVATIIDLKEDKDSWSFLYGEFRKKVS